MLFSFDAQIEGEINNRMLFFQDFGAIFFKGNVKQVTDHHFLSLIALIFFIGQLRFTFQQIFIDLHQFFRLLIGSLRIVTCIEDGGDRQFATEDLRNGIVGMFVVDNTDNNL